MKKNKYFYAIYKLKIKSWIKYWLIKQTEFKGVLSDILEGISFYLTDSLNMKFKMFDVIGRTTQDGNPTPENPVPIKNTGDNVNLFDKDTMATRYYRYFSSETVWNTSSDSFSIAIPCSPNKTYTLSHSISTATIFRCGYITTSEIPTTGNVAVSNGYMGTIDLSHIINTGENATYIIFQGNAVLMPDIIETLKLEESEKSTPYSPYGCGNVNEKVQNKNLFDENNVTFITGILDDNGNPTGSTSSHYTENFYQVEAETQYAISGTLDMGTNINRIYFYDENKNWLSRTGPQSGGRVFITPANCKYLRIQVPFGITLKTGDVQLEQNSTATSYQAHAEQNLSFPLAQGQKLMEGDYLADDGVHHVMSQVVLDGTESITYNHSTPFDYFLVDKTLVQVPYYNSDLRNSMLCTHFKTMKNAIVEFIDNGIALSSNKNRFVIVCTSFETVTEFKTWLAEQYRNGTPITVQYELASEVIDPYTEEQQIAWEEIKALRTYKGETHISSEDETPALLKIQYWKEA